MLETKKHFSLKSGTYKVHGLERKAFVVIVAGGTGTRMKSKVPKQFILINNKPIIFHTIQQFVDAIPEINIVVVLAKPLILQWQKLCSKHKFSHKVQLAEGGKTRFDSVKHGLAMVPDGCIVGVHDAARPLVSKHTIINCFKQVISKGNAVPFVPITESIREVNGSSNKIADRNKFVTIQTPQCFLSDNLKKTFLQKYNVSFTDEASVIEKMGEKINLIEGNKENIKITTREDLRIAEALLKLEN